MHRNICLPISYGHASHIHFSLFSLSHCKMQMLSPTSALPIRRGSVIFPSTFPNTQRFPFPNPLNWKPLSCKAASSSSSSSLGDLDLYDLLGIDSSSDQAQIKLAYRALQKRCHPDIAGPPGHDMAIVLNEAYAVLSDPNSRFVYDKEQSKFADLRGYTGKPIYSAWFGPESENRAVIVDEVRCVGCLKCALFAEKTFAVESVYGRARVVAQWADPEYKIQEAMGACPVDCISVVERSDLAALEFLMSKKPRGNVRIGAGNAVGARTSSIFDDLEKFQARFHDANTNKSSKAHSNVSDEERDAQNSAIQAIRAMSNWLYWQSPRSGITQLQQSLVLIGEKPNEPNIEKLKAAAAARKQGKLTISATHIYSDEYWIPSNLVLPEPTKMNTPGNKPSPQMSRSKKHKETSEQDSLAKKHDGSRPWSMAIPVVTGTIGAVTVWLQIPGDGEVLPGGLNEHLGGSLALDIINSSGLQVILAGVTWYLIGLYITELVEALLSVTKGHSK
nr:uncharacterized protein LOC109160126 [Ipomoea trifida]